MYFAQLTINQGIVADQLPNSDKQVNANSKLCSEASCGRWQHEREQQDGEAKRSLGISGLGRGLVCNELLVQRHGIFGKQIGKN
jgi:hypothetical protein